jgi:hypothetical protein
MRILLLGVENRSTKILFNFLSNNFELSGIIVEDSVSTFNFLKYRLKNNPLIRFLDQLIFMFVGVKILNYISLSRQNEIIHTHGMDLSPIPSAVKQKVKSINSPESIKVIIKISPDLIILSGTRILSKKMISSVNTPIINLHAGITPNYRGVHGAYWALSNTEPELAGVTLHFVDQGVDTGQVIAQSRIHITKSDQFSTYPLLQLAEGMKLLNEFLIKYGDKIPYSVLKLGTKKSNQWFHPGFFEYIYRRIRYGVK